MHNEKQFQISEENAFFKTTYNIYIFDEVGGVAEWKF